jgi:hypothetical protein
MAGTVAPEQTVTSLTDATIGVGFIVIVKVLVLPPALVQLRFVAETVIVPTIFEPVLFAGAAKLMLPVPDTPKPISGLVFVQLIDAPPTLLPSGILTASVGQKL